MANLPEPPEWPDGVYQIETPDPVLGGPDGIANKAARALASRTVWLRAKFDALIEGTVAAYKATRLATARKLSISGAASGNASFDGSADANISITLADSGVAAGVYQKVTVNIKGLVIDGGALSSSDIPDLDWSKIKTGKPTTLGGYGITDALGINGTAVAARKLETARSISISGAASGSASFDGSANANVAIALADIGVIPGSYAKVTINAKGLVVGSVGLVQADIPSLDWSKITSGKPTTLQGYDITDAIKIGSYGLAGTVAPGSSIDTIGLPGGFHYFGDGATSFAQFVSVINVPYGGPGYAAQIGFQQGTTEPRVLIRSVKNSGTWTPTREVWHTGNFDPNAKANKASTLAGYGITDTYTAAGTNQTIANSFADFSASKNLAVPAFLNGFYDANTSRYWTANGNLYVSIDFARGAALGAQTALLCVLPPGARPRFRCCGTGDWVTSSPLAFGYLSWSLETNGYLTIDLSVGATNGAGGYQAQIHLCTQLA